MKNITTALITILSIPSLFAQETISLDQAIKTALEVHPKIKMANLSMERETAQGKANRGLDKTSIDFSRGQLNTYYKKDYQLYINQSFKFPTYYKNTKNYTNEAVKLKQLESELTKNEIIYEVAGTYYTLLNLQDQIKITEELQVLTQEALKIEQNKLQKGESSAIRSENRKMELYQIENEIFNLKQKYTTSLQYLGSLTGNTSPIAIEYTPFFQEKEEVQSIDTASLPLIAYQQQQIELSEAQVKATKSATLPEWYAGYFNQTINDEGTKALNGFNLGLQIPLFYSKQKNQIKAARLDAAIKEEELNAQKITLEQQINRQRQYVSIAQNSMTAYQQKILPVADNLRKLYKSSSDKGELSALEYLASEIKYLNLKKEYAQKLLDYNLAVLQLKVLTGKL